ncbi:hypothetical protein [Bacillus sp. 3255]|nr:hypothetical protein [Bacillus sp. 3255]MDR6883089.1 hypothetical protein [Bacillus sp. 3255]MDR6884854.1 hypothetical protein [Bacillus sp. 3255]
MMKEKRFTFRVKGWLLEKLLKEKKRDVSKIVREALIAHYGGESK